MFLFELCGFHFFLYEICLSFYVFHIKGNLLHLRYSARLALVISQFKNNLNVSCSGRWCSPSVPPLSETSCFSIFPSSP